MLFPLPYLPQVLSLLIFWTHAKTGQAANISSTEKHTVLYQNQYLKRGEERQIKSLLNNQKAQYHEQLAKTERGYYWLLSFSV